MNVLLLRLTGPLQSWGLQSRYASVRDTGLYPSKSGVIGLVAAALGRPRGADISDLAGLSMGVRSDQEGHLETDFHTAGQGGIWVVSGQVVPDARVVSHRQYLADASFLAGLAGDDLLLLTMIQTALQRPHWPLYLGRKAFLPSAPVWLPDGLRRDTTLPAALAAYPWLGSAARYDPTARLRLVVEDPAGPETLPDQPLSFPPQGASQYAPRRVRQEFIPCPAPREDSPC